MIEKSFGLFFFLKQPKNQKGDERYIYLRITVDGISKEISTKRMWTLSRWDQRTGRPKGKTEEVAKLCAYLDNLKLNVYSIKSQLMLADKEITAEIIKKYLTGNGEERRMLLCIFKKHNQNIEELIGKDYQPRTFKRYRTTFDHTKAFINWKYGKEDIDLKDLNYEFAKDFSFWLKTIKCCNHNSAMKYVSTLKTVILECMKKKWLREDPFSEFSTAQKEVEIIPLDAVELSIIQNKKFSFERLNLVKDIFIFSCYTGLAYIDTGNLKQGQIRNGIDGQKWIITKRQKTDTPQRIPLLAPALEIIEKYKDHPRCMQKGYALPILTNQKMNAYLKEIADVCGIEKKLTFHIARHTFATTVTLCNGVPIETVSSMLGHKRLTQTQHYAKIIDLKVSEDMALLRKRLS
ncbi:site-specific integrase [Mucilaginibacter ginsenosidivorans]|uniref:Site-specific integrase n=3 Tax=Mucilaginibacter TaxID=423349 RepID=A0A5B8US98_9SPHI|nr:site-specific integrase [Mucilaginibacter ginsenosidivorans]MBE9668162.1 site-specific integrase [Mucilaginibacter boryungensis]QEC61904.1 site-specific integrase [Mucilaginibacter ginsenosidivorans]